MDIPCGPSMMEQRKADGNPTQRVFGLFLAKSAVVLLSDENISVESFSILRRQIFVFPQFVLYFHHQI